MIMKRISVSKLSLKFICFFFFFFFFKQKTAYEIYQCDWSSDVCSSDLLELQSASSAPILITEGDIDLGISSISGAARTIRAIGSGTNIDIFFTPKGTGTLTVPTGYEANITDDVDLVNKKWIDDQGFVSGAFGSTFLDDVFRIQDNADATKEIAFQASGIATATVRTITMPNNNVNLGTDFWKTTGTSALTGATIIDGNGNDLSLTDNGVVIIDSRDGSNITIKAGVVASSTTTLNLLSYGSGGINLISYHTGDILINTVGAGAVVLTSNLVKITTTPSSGGADDILTWNSTSKAITKVAQSTFEFNDANLVRDNTAETITVAWTHNANLKMGDGWSVQFGSGVDYKMFYDSASDDFYLETTSSVINGRVVFRDGLTTERFIFNTKGTNVGLLQIGTTNATSGYQLELGTKGRAVDWTNTSDRDLKRNINPYGEVLSDIDKMDGFLSTYYRVKDPSKKPELGMIAQDVKKVFSLIVDGDKSKGEDLGLSYGRMGAISIQGIADLHKKMNSEIKSLREEIAELKK